MDLQVGFANAYPAEKKKARNLVPGLLQLTGNATYFGALMPNSANFASNGL
jgi:hypothetical protein